MNGKRAKQIRRLARRETVGAPLIAYTGSHNGGTQLHPDCTRALEQRYKAVWKLMRGQQA